MNHIYFKNLENDDIGCTYKLQPFIDHLAFNADGLIPVITQDVTTNKVLMLAWMNKESIFKTIDKKRMVYWSRSRKKLWIKGETSSNIQKLISMKIDCDGDSLLCLVEQTGSACHTQKPDCFYFDINLKKLHISMT